MRLEIIYLTYMYKEDLGLNNLQWMIYHKNPTKTDHTLSIIPFPHASTVSETEWR